MLVVKRAGRTLFGVERHVGEVVDDSDLGWHQRKVLVENHYVDEMPETAEPVACVCGRRFTTREAMERAGHGDCAAGGNNLFRLTTEQLLSEARSRDLDVSDLDTTKSGRPKRTALISALSRT